MDDLKYPIGKFQWPNSAKDEDRARWVAEIADTPDWLREAIEGLSEEQLDTPYRPEGWTVRQIVHHLADSHVNAYVRIRLALTEDTPTIRPYDQDGWANLSDAKLGPIEPSLVLLEAIHERWVSLVSILDDDDLHRQLVHPESDRKMDIDTVLAMYAWHGRHHVAHITELRQRMGW
jgi:DinB family protein